jgi:HEPN domain-containing protein
MCHLTIEKALKGFFAKNIQKNPPKTHDLNYLCKNLNLKLPEELQRFMDSLNDLSVPTRYPDEIEKLIKDYNKIRVKDILKITKRLLSWLKENI